MSPSMPPRRLPPPVRALALAMAAALLGGCASLKPEDTLSTTRAHLGDTSPALLIEAAVRDAARQQVAAALQQPLSAEAAVAIALRHSPELQALLAEAWASELDIRARGRPANLHLAWERLVHDGASEFTRSLGLSVNDWLLWPVRHRQAEQAAQAARARLASQVVAKRHAVRQQWVRAVAAQAQRVYHDQVREAADATAELARRMQAVGHFGRLQRARHQAFQADAAAQQHRAEALATAEREALVRALGLDALQAAQLQLPDRLPDLPAQARTPAEVTAAAQAHAPLGVAVARAEAAALGAVPAALAAVPPLELTAARSRSGAERARSTELGLSLPLGDAVTPARARQWAAGQRQIAAEVDQASRLREAYATYRQAHALARLQHDVLVPLRQTIQDEVLLHYNGMLLSVFELLAEARAQVTAVIAALDARRDFWLADTALQAAIDGVPSVSGAMAAGASPAGPGSGATDAAH